MIRFSSLRKAIIVAACLISQHAIAQINAPAEQKTAQIKRTETSQNVLTGTLTKNLFKTETYQAPYTVQVPYEAEETYTVEVPYQAEETYTVEVPYQIDETYTIEVPYQDTETYVENVAYEVDVPYTEWVTEYRQEYKCHDVTRYRQECRNEQKCYLVPGTGGQQCRMVEECGVNVHGQRICKTRQVCDDNPAQQRCDTHQVCSNVPYTDRDCRYENVPYQTQVTRYRSETRYRQETRTRTVTKTRTETRTRTVTKYRDEQRCCETKTREVFDRQIQFQVEVSFPQEAQLLTGESELININLLSADATTAKVDLKVVNSIYGYRIANQSVTGAVIRVELALVPKFDLTNAGPDSIEALKIEWANAAQKLQVSFNDKITSKHIQNAYVLVISDLANGAELEKLDVVALANGKLGALVNAVADPQAKIKATLVVKRSGIIVAGTQINFETSATYEKRTAQASDIAALSVAKSITTTLSGSGVDSAIVIDDLASAFADIKTTYQIYLDLVVGGASKPLNVKTFSSDEVKAMNGIVKMSAIIGASSALKTGNKISYTMVVKRTATSNVLSGKTIKFEKEQAFILQ